MVPPLGRALFALAGLAAFCVQPARAERITGKDIDPERELLITAPSVVDSEIAKYPGSWSFGALIEELVGRSGAPFAVRDWLYTWMVEQNIDNRQVASRLDIYQKLILPWQKRDGYDPDKSAHGWEPQLANAPFRLLAIVNRMDLCAPEVANSTKLIEDAWRINGEEKKFRELIEQGTGVTLFGGGGGGGGYGFSAPRELSRKPQVQSAGEGRLVFGAVDGTGAPLDGGFTVIFEYDLRTTEKRGVREWAQAWHGLASRDLKDQQFAAALETLTREFTHNKPGLLQLRTNEAAFGKGREFRQFSAAGASLAPALLAQTPAPVFTRRGSAEQRVLTQFLNDQEPLIRSGIHLLPGALPLRNTSIPVHGGNAIIPAGEPNFFWNITQPVSRESRRMFSLNTCNGCHAGETACITGLHIAPRAEGQEAVLSTFLRRDRRPSRVNDPDVPGRKIEYDEMNDRAAILAALLEPRDRGTVDALRPILRARLSRTH